MLLFFFETERKREKERERERETLKHQSVAYQLPLTGSLTQIEPATQASALTRNGTCDLSMYAGEGGVRDAPTN